MKTTIFYENSFGIISQWTGEVLKYDKDSISIKFSANKAYKYDLKGSNAFCVVTKTKLKETIVPQDELLSCDDELKTKIKEICKNNTLLMWDKNIFEF